MKPFLAHDSLGRVLQSLIASVSCSQRTASPGTAFARSLWKDDFLLVGDGTNALGLDSLEVLQISAAVNEMFHLYEAGLEMQLLQQTSFGQWLNTIEEAWQRGVRHLTITTSGSTGLPKRCTHAFSNLMIEMDFLAELFKSRSRIVAFTTAHHLYGLLFTALLPERLACPVYDLLEAADASTKQGGSTLQAGDLVVSFPQGWEWIERSFCAMPIDVEGVVSTAPCPSELIKSLVPGKLSRLTEVYGSSETSGIGTRTSPQTTYSLMPHWSRESSADSAPATLRHRAGFSVELMDHLDFSPDGTFLLDGRRDAGVQVGGVNVFPSAIQNRISKHLGVAEAAVRLMRPEEGKRLKCFVVPQAGHTVEALRMVLDKWIRSWPIAAERPHTIKFGPAIPRSMSGKNSDWD